MWMKESGNNVVKFYNLEGEGEWGEGEGRIAIMGILSLFYYNSADKERRNAFFNALYAFFKLI